MNNKKYRIRQKILFCIILFSLCIQPCTTVASMQQLQRALAQFGKSIESFTETNIGKNLLQLGTMAISLWIVERLRAQMAGTQAKALLTHSINPIKVTDVTLKDYIGVPPEVDILVDQIQNRTYYQKLKAPFTKGILLTGDPGTGKTFLARAIAGETQVPFFNLSATELIQSFKGSSPLMIRELFKNAKIAALKDPSKIAIIFIDELDAIAGSRGAGQIFGSEPSGALETLLTEMNEFNKINAETLPEYVNIPWYKKFYQKLLKAKEPEIPEISVLVLGATNIPDKIDSALKRPGRFDDIIHIQNPTRDAREAIIKLHLQKYPCSEDIKSDKLAIITKGMTPASIDALFKSAARFAGSKRHNKLEIQDFCRAIFSQASKEKSLNKDYILKTLITMYPCDTSLNVIQFTNVTIKGTGGILAMFENAYQKKYKKTKQYITLKNLSQ